MAKKQTQTDDFEIKKASEELTKKDLDKVSGGWTLNDCPRECSITSSCRSN